MKMQLTETDLNEINASQTQLCWMAIVLIITNYVALILIDGKRVSHGLGEAAVVLVPMFLRIYTAIGCWQLAKALKWRFAPVYGLLVFIPVGLFQVPIVAWGELAWAEMSIRRGRKSLSSHKSTVELGESALQE